jgi:hypothetical protein
MSLFRIGRWPYHPEAAQARTALPTTSINSVPCSIDPAVIAAAETAAGTVDGVVHAHARARWTRRTLRVEVEGWTDPDLTVSQADALGRQVALAIARQLPDMGSFTWTMWAAPRLSAPPARCRPGRPVSRRGGR